MKPLSIDELKALKVGDWVWIIDKENCENTGYYRTTTVCQNLILFAEGISSHNFEYSNYGIKWLAYKNKEQVCPHEVCCFPECENQSYCLESLVKAQIDNMKAKGEIVELPCNSNDNEIIGEN